MTKNLTQYVYKMTLIILFLGVLSYFYKMPVFAQDEEPQYVVEDGMVDKATYNGYRRFHGICHTCHGQDGLGSTFAPSLIESLKDVDYETFKATLIEGRTVTNADGSTSAMPSFEENADVMKYQDDIYRFLKARSDGVLAPGRPKKIPQ